MRVAVIGGGISGLSAAWELRMQAEVTVFEASRFGGCLLTEEFAGHDVDLGPDAFITRVPDAVGLCVELGLGADLVAPSAGRSMLWLGDRLRPLPEGLVLGVPRSPRAIARAGILSPAGGLRALLDLVLPASKPVAGRTVRELVASRLGPQVADRLVAPLVGSIYAGDIADLGASETVPQLAQAAERHRSLILALRRMPASTSDGPVFLAPRHGLGQLVSHLVAALESAGVTFLTEAVEGPIRRTADDALIVSNAHPPFDAAVIALPTAATATVLGAAYSDALSDVPVASVSLVVAALEGNPLPPEINGFIVSPSTGRLTTACSFGSNKWPHWSEPGRALVRISAGRYGEPSGSLMGDDQLTERLLTELELAVGQSLNVIQTRVVRWPNSFPQYRPGHLRRIQELQDRVQQDLPGVALAGSAFSGIGIPACIASGRNAARRAVERSRVGVRGD